MSKLPNQLLNKIFAQTEPHYMWLLFDLIVSLGVLRSSVLSVCDWKVFLKMCKIIIPAVTVRLR